LAEKEKNIVRDYLFMSFLSLQGTAGRMSQKCDVPFLLPAGSLKEKSGLK
jgi:hypothetical protein